MRVESRATELHNYATLVVQSASLLNTHGKMYDRRHRENVHRYGQAVVGLDLLRTLYLDLLGRSWNSTAATVTRQRFELVRPRPRLSTESHSALVLSKMIHQKRGDKSDVENSRKIHKEHQKQSLMYFLLAGMLVCINVILVMWLWRATRAHTREWQRGFLACLLFVAMDVLIHQCNVAFLVGFVIPRTVSKLRYVVREKRQ